jgi:uroporphyrinogen-III synthase
VAAVLERIEAPPQGVRIAAVGPSTADAVTAGGWPVHRIPEVGSGAGLVEAFRVAGDAEGARMFFPASAAAREEIPKGLAGLGARVHQVTAYRLVELPLDRDRCSAALKAGEVQAVTFASPSAMEGLRKGLGDDLFSRMAREIPAAAMGSTTAGALEGAGWKRIVVAQEPSLEALGVAGMQAAAPGSPD